MVFYKMKNCITAFFIYLSIIFGFLIVCTPASAQNQIVFEIPFATNSLKISEKSEAEIKFLVDSLNKSGINQFDTLLIQGHTDNAGSHEINDRISLQRAELIEEFIKELIPNAIYVVRGHGKRKPKYAIDSDYKNRRVEILFIPSVKIIHENAVIRLNVIDSVSLLPADLSKSYLYINDSLLSHNFFFDEIHVLPGTYIVTIESEDFFTSTTECHISKNENLSIVVYLTPEPVLALDSASSDAYQQFDSLSTGRDSLNIDNEISEILFEDQKCKFSQCENKSWAIGVSMGSVFLWGDGSDNVNNPFSKFFIPEQRNYGFTVKIEKTLNNFLNFEAEYVYGKAKGERTVWSNNLIADFRFITHFQQFHMQAYIYPLVLTKFNPCWFQPFFSAGIGVSSHRSIKYRLSTGEIIDYQGYCEEMKKTTPVFNLVFPYGGGVDFPLSCKVRLRIAQSYTYITSDNFDGHIGLGTNVNDIYSYTSLGLIIKIFKEIIFIPY